MTLHGKKTLKNQTFNFLNEKRIKKRNNPNVNKISKFFFLYLMTDNVLLLKNFRIYIKSLQFLVHFNKIHKHTLKSHFY